MPVLSLVKPEASRNIACKCLVILSLTALGSACQRTGEAEPGHTTPARDSATPVIMTVNYPLLAMAQAITGDALTVSLPKIPGDPAFWQPDTNTLIDYQQADRILDNGAGYARWLSTISLPQHTRVDTSAGFREQLIDIPGVRHSHGPGATHDHGLKAFTTWLDMELAAAQATAIRDALLTLPESATDAPARSQIGRGHADLQQRLKGYHRRLQAAGGQLQNVALLYSHPVYQYLQRAYRLNGHALHWEPDQRPTESQWQELTRMLEHHPAKLMLWEDEPLPETRERLETMGLTVLVFSPAANYPASGDYWSVMETNISALEDYAEALDGS